MCGRYLLRKAPPGTTMSWEEYHDRISGIYQYPLFNICPTQGCIVLSYEGGKIDARIMTWGFKPAWSSYRPLINAKAENLFESKMFKHSILHKRCIIVADGFYEPKGEEGQKNRPWYLFEYPDQRTFAIAGIWIEGGFAIITNASNTQVAPVHSRMPHMLPPEHWKRWLDSSLTDEAELAALLQSTEYEGMQNYQVSDYAKKPGNEGPKCIEKAIQADVRKLL